MNKILSNISGKVDPEHVEAISEIKKITDLLEIEFFIIGATARDFLLEYLHDIKAPRKTMDIDFGVRIKNWKQFSAIETELLKNLKKTAQNHRFKYKNTIIDIVPFGDISNDSQEISWPPEYDIMLNVSGFEEVYKCSCLVKLDEKSALTIKVPTIPGLAILKLLSWKHSYPERQKDSEDLYFIMLNYEVVIFKKLYNKEYEELLESENFDNKMASIRILGQDMVKICNINILKEITNILEEETSETSNFNLVVDIMGNIHDFDKILELLCKLKQGVVEST